jgi:hypothetical protein
MSINYGNSVAGLRSERTYSPRPVLYTTQGAVYLPEGKTIAGASSRDPGNTGDIVTLRPGELLGKITSSGKYAPAVLGALTVAYTASATVMTVSAAVATEIARRVGSTGTLIMTGPPTAAGTIATTAVTYSAVNTSSGVLTVTAITAANYILGSLIRPNDGSQTILGILDEYVRVTDVDGNNLDVQGSKILTGGFVDAEQIIDYPSNAVIQAWLKGQLNSPATGPGPFSFDDNF